MVFRGLEIIREVATVTGSNPKKHPGRFHDLNNFVDVSMRDLTRAEIAVWLVLFRNARDRIVRISHSQIAAASGCSVKAVSVAMKLLIQKTIVKQLIQGTVNRGPSTYKVRGFSD